jgi:hypothetical protein
MSTKNVSKEMAKAEGWDIAIAEGEKQLKMWRSKVARLMASIQTFKEAKAIGTPWPGENKKGPQEGGQ